MKTTDDVLSTVPAPAGSDVRVEPVRYDHEGTALLGVLAKDHAASGPRPGVLVIHDWHGVNEHVEARVTMLARLGYVAFGADVYGADGPHILQQDPPFSATDPAHLTATESSKPAFGSHTNITSASDP